jgi:ferric-dicitrate binding protein FerR (iron transport regulator)
VTEHPEPAQSAAPHDRPPGPVRGLVLVAGAVVLAIVLGGVMYYAVFRHEARPEPAPPSVPLTLIVESVDGPVEVLRGAAWTPAPAGTVLHTTERVRTGEGGGARLRLSDGSSVVLEAATETEVQALGRALSRIRLGTGLVQAEIADDPRRLFQVDLDDAGATARTHGATFSVARSGAGSTAAVTAARGEVTVAARGREVVIRSGEITRVAPGAPPTAPAPLLLLKVAWPDGKLHSHTIVLDGRTDPGARVQVQDRHVPVASDGRYRAEVRLREGANRITVRARDVGGLTRQEISPPLRVDTQTDFKVQVPRWK